MNTKNFENLLTDLYSYYNPAKLKDIPMLLSKYNGREFDAIKSVFIVYNSRYNKDKFNQDYGTDTHIQYLIKNYSEQKRVFSKGALKEKEDEVIKTKTKQEEEEEKNKLKKFEEIGGQLKSEIQEAVNIKVEEYFKTKKGEVDEKLNCLFEEKSQEIVIFFDGKREEIEKNINAVPDIVNKIISSEKLVIREDAPKIKDIVEVKLTFLNCGDRDLILPGLEVMKTVGIGERMIVKDSVGKICGIEIKDVVYDNVSFEDGTYIKDISIEKI